MYLFQNVGSRDHTNTDGGWTTYPYIPYIYFEQFCRILKIYIVATKTYTILSHMIFGIVIIDFNQLTKVEYP